MFIDEARITAQLDHRHIVQVFELGTDADTPYIAMQYVDGLDVLALLRECARAQIRLPPDLARADRARRARRARLRAQRARRAGPRARHRPPRHLAGQRAAVVARRRQAHRLRHRARRRAPPQDRGRHAQGQVRLHVARAGLGRRGRRAQRSVLGRHPARRDGDGAPAVHVDERPRHPADGARRAPRSPAQVRVGVPGRAARAHRARAAAPPRGSLAERGAVPRCARRVDPPHDARHARAISRS